MNKKICTFLILALMSLGCGCMFTSCENDAPEMNINLTYNHVSDFSGLVDAVNNQTAVLKVAIDQNGNVVMTALDRNGNEIRNAITEGFRTATASIADKLNSLVLSLDKNTLALVDMKNTLAARLEALRKTAEAAGASLVYAINDNGEVIAMAVAANGEVIAAELINQTEQLKLLNKNIVTANNKLVAAIDKNTLAVTTLDNNTRAAIQALQTEVALQGGHIETAINTQGVLLVAAFNANGQLIKTEIAGVATKLEAVQAAIGTLDANLNTLVTANTAAIATFDDDNKQKLADIEAAIGAIGTSIVVNVSGSLDDVTTAINEQKAAIVAALDSNGSLIQTAIGEVKDELTNYRTDFNAAMSQLYFYINANTTAIATLDANNAAAINALKAKIAGDAEGTLVTALVDQKTAIVSALTGTGGVAASIVAKLEGINTTLGTIATAVTGINTQLSTNLSAMLTALQTIATNSAYLSNLEKLTNLDDIKTYLASLPEIKTVLDNIKSNTDKLSFLEAISTAVADINTNTTGLPDKLEAIKTAIEALKINSGVYTIGSDYYMTQAVYDAIKDNPTLSHELATDMFGSSATPETDISFTVSPAATYPSGHSYNAPTMTKIVGVGSAAAADSYGLIKVKPVYAFATVTFPKITCGNAHYYTSVSATGVETKTETHDFSEARREAISLTVKTWNETTHSPVNVTATLTISGS